MSVLFVDTSAIYAGIDRCDPVSEPATATWRRLLDADVSLVSHALVEVETLALVQRRLGLAAVEMLRDRFLPQLRVIEVEREHRREVLRRVSMDGSRAVSLVDRVSFDLMHRLSIDTAFAFDRHFAEAGFNVIGPDA